MLFCEGGVSGMELWLVVGGWGLGVVSRLRGGREKGLKDSQRARQVRSAGGEWMRLACQENVVLRWCGIFV